MKDLHDAENELTARGTCFSHTGLDYMAQSRSKNIVL